MTIEEANQRTSIMRDDIRGVFERIIAENNNLDLSNEASVFGLIYDGLVNKYKEGHEDKSFELEVLNVVNQRFENGEVKLSDIGIDISSMKKRKKEVEDAVDFLTTGAGTDGNLEKDSEEEDKKKSLESLNQMIGYINEHIDSMSNGDNQKRDMLNESLQKLKAVKSDFENDKLNCDECDEILLIYNSNIYKEFSHNILNIYHNNRQSGNNNNDEEEIRELNDIIDFMISRLKDERSGINLNKKLGKIDALDNLSSLKEKLNNGEIRLEECKKEVRRINSDIIDNCEINLLEMYYDCLHEKKSISVDNYDDLLARVNNYIELMSDKEKMNLALWSSDAVEKGRSVGRYYDLKRRLTIISEKVGKKDGSLEELTAMLEDVADELKKDYDLELSMIQPTKRHKVVKTRKGNIRRVLGVTVSNALFLSGLIQIPQLITVFNLYGYTHNIGECTLKVAAYVVVPIVTDILLKCSNKKELLIISHILNKIRSTIKNNEVENKRGAR